jgi:prophage antirepressor-like protein
VLFCKASLALLAFNYKEIKMNNIKLFEYEHKKIRTIFAHGQEWFVAKDTVEALGVTWFGTDTLAAIKLNGL